MSELSTSGDLKTDTTATNTTLPCKHEMHFMEDKILPVHTGRILTKLDETSDWEEKLEVLSRERFSFIAALYSLPSYDKIERIRKLNALYALVSSEDGRETRRFQPLDWFFDLWTCLWLSNPFPPAPSPEAQHDVGPNLGADMFLILRWDECPPTPSPDNGQRPQGISRGASLPQTTRPYKRPSLPRTRIVFSPTRSDLSTDPKDLWSIKLRAGDKDPEGKPLLSGEKADLRSPVMPFESLLLSPEIDTNAQMVFVDMKDVAAPNPTAKKKGHGPSKSSSKTPLTVVVRLYLGPTQYATAKAARDLWKRMNASGIDPKISSRRDTGLVHIAWTILHPTAYERHTSSVMATMSLINRQDAKVIPMNGNTEIVACVQACNTTDEKPWFKQEAVAYLESAIKAGPPPNMHQWDTTTKGLRDAGIEVAIQHLSKGVVSQQSQIEDDGWVASASDYKLN